ncbi:rod shape-determining protein MreD [Caldithrix abyssi]|uniref:Rod shape-determining protein MreD n=1 Tax=Caldithrix abyssi DSM 13497 TaxID=880073 RepID=H1XSC7_CALAY|nr:rod shape-determining protein MreD [Caldithrix abyssi]APF17203.1 rod shape-determining protein MreD [Caldithrix abyssi DSM 13497]EHO41339.1 rod shape-determining protein MreD [Caldithrix abyssi DSM 13497]
MKHENKWFLVLLLLFGVPAILAQALIVPLLRINIWQPDVVLCIVLLLSKRFGAMHGSTSGFFLGLLQDALTGLPVGMSAFPKAFVGYLAGKFHGQHIKGLFMDLWFVLFILIHEIIFYIFLGIKAELNITEILITRALPDVIYTMIALLVINLFVKKYLSEE